MQRNLSSESQGWHFISELTGEYQRTLPNNQLKPWTSNSQNLTDQVWSGCQTPKDNISPFNQTVPNSLNPSTINRKHSKIRIGGSSRTASHFSLRSLKLEKVLGEEREKGGYSFADRTTMGSTLGLTHSTINIRDKDKDKDKDKEKSSHNLTLPMPNKEFLNKPTTATAVDRLYTHNIPWWHGIRFKPYQTFHPSAKLQEWLELKKYDNSKEEKEGSESDSSIDPQETEDSVGIAEWDNPQREKIRNILGTDLKEIITKFKNRNKFKSSAFVPFDLIHEKQQRVFKNKCLEAKRAEINSKSRKVLRRNLRQTPCLNIVKGKYPVGFQKLFFPGLEKEEVGDLALKLGNILWKGALTPTMSSRYMKKNKMEKVEHKLVLMPSEQNTPMGGRKTKTPQLEKGTLFSADHSSQFSTPQGGITKDIYTDAQQLDIGGFSAFYHTRTNEDSHNNNNLDPTLGSSKISSNSPNLKEVNPVQLEVPQFADPPEDVIIGEEFFERHIRKEFLNKVNNLKKEFLIQREQTKEKYMREHATELETKNILPQISQDVIDNLMNHLKTNKSENDLQDKKHSEQAKKANYEHVLEDPDDVEAKNSIEKQLSRLDEIYNECVSSQHRTKYNGKWWLKKSEWKKPRPLPFPHTDLYKFLLQLKGTSADIENYMQSKDKKLLHRAESTLDIKTRAMRRQSQLNAITYKDLGDRLLKTKIRKLRVEAPKYASYDPEKSLMTLRETTKSKVQYEQYIKKPKSKPLKLYKPLKISNTKNPIINLKVKEVKKNIYDENMGRKREAKELKTYDGNLSFGSDTISIKEDTVIPLINIATSQSAAKGIGLVWAQDTFKKKKGESAELTIPRANTMRIKRAETLKKKNTLASMNKKFISSTQCLGNK